MASRGDRTVDNTNFPSVTTTFRVSALAPINTATTITTTTTTTSTGTTITTTTTTTTSTSLGSSHVNNNSLEVPSTRSSGSRLRCRVQSNSGRVAAPPPIAAPASRPTPAGGRSSNQATTEPRARTTSTSASGFSSSNRSRRNDRGRGNSGRDSFAGISRRNNQHSAVPIANRAMTTVSMPGGGRITTRTANSLSVPVHLSGVPELDVPLLQLAMNNSGAPRGVLVFHRAPERARVVEDTCPVQ